MFESVYYFRFTSEQKNSCFSTWAVTSRNAFGSFRNWRDICAKVYRLQKSLLEQF